MGFVDDYHGDVDMWEFGEEEVVGEAFGCEVEEFAGVEDAVVVGCEYLVVGHHGVDGVCEYAASSEGGYLVGHKCEEWCYDEAGAVECEGWYLEGYGFASAGGH